MFSPIKNPSDPEIIGLIRQSKQNAARRLVDERTGDAWYWPAEQATHAEGAARLEIPYDRPPGMGEIVTL